LLAAITHHTGVYRVPYPGTQLIALIIDLKDEISEGIGPRVDQHPPYGLVLKIVGCSTACGLFTAVAEYQQNYQPHED